MAKLLTLTDTNLTKLSMIFKNPIARMQNPKIISPFNFSPLYLQPPIDPTILPRFQSKSLKSQIVNKHHQQLIDLQQMNTAEEFLQLKQRMQVRRTETLKFRTVNTFKWKQLILASIQQLALFPGFDQTLVAALRKLVAKISEDIFIEAIINMQPLKPNFSVCTYLRNMHTNSRQVLLRRRSANSPAKDFQEESTTTGSVLKESHFDQKSAAKKMKDTYDHFTTMIEQQTLRKEFSSAHHPFTKIIEGLTLLLQGKYKAFVEKMEKEDGCVIMEIFIRKMEADVKMVHQLFKMVSKPVIQIFCSEGSRERSKFQQDFDNFLINFLRNNSKYCNSLRRILKWASKRSIEVLQFQHFCQPTAEIDNFDIPTQFKIKGNYIYTTREIAEFTETVKGKRCLQALSLLRLQFYKDISQAQRPEREREVNSAVQLEIFKFLLSKLKHSVSDVFAQLKYLELIYGEEEMAFQYEDASFMHAQLMIAFEAIRLKLD